MTTSEQPESSDPVPQSATDNSESRRGFLTASTVAMGGGVVAGYGVLGVMAGQYLYPSGNKNLGWQYVAVAGELVMGQSLEYTAPDGSKVVVARQGEGNTADDFVALSSVCPHLGCAVHWEPQNDRFFCPCHNGVFDKTGAPKEGPPAAANQHLVRYPLKVENGLLFIEAPLVRLTSNEEEHSQRLACTYSSQNAPPDGQEA